MLDTVCEVSTPELIELRLHCAGPVPRALAWLVDLMIRFGITIVLGIALSFLKSMGTALYLIMFFALEWFYPVFFEVLAHGATPGKRMLGLMVVSRDGSPVGWGASFTRNLMRTADFFPFLYGFGLISMLLSRHACRLGDIVAGTLVVYTPANNRAIVLPDATPWHGTGLVSADAQRAVLAFAERAPLLHADRAAELANHVPQLTDGAQGALAVTRLYGLARTLTGRTQ